MLDVEPYINALSDGVIVIRGNEGEYFGSTIEPERIDEFGITERSIHDLCLNYSGVVVNDVIRAQQYYHVAAVAAVIATLDAFVREERQNLAKLNFYAPAVDDAARKKNPSTNRIGDKTFARSMMEVVRAIPLLDFSIKHDADFVSHGKGLVLVVRNQYNGHALAFKNVAHFDRQTLAQVNIKI